MSGKTPGTKPKATIQLEGSGSFTDVTYRLALEGKVTVAIPGSNSSAIGQIYVTSRGDVGGSVDGLTLQLAGLGLGASSVKIQTVTAATGLEVGFAQTAVAMAAALDPPFLPTITLLPNEPGFIVINAKSSDVTEKVTTLQIIATAAEIMRSITVQVTIQPHRLYFPFMGR